MAKSTLFKRENVELAKELYIGKRFVTSESKPTGMQT